MTLQRGAFLELCAAGVIQGCRKQSSLNRNANGEYALRVLKAIRADENLLSAPGRLWRAAVKRGSKRENGQVNVVVSLWAEGLIQ